MKGQVAIVVGAGLAGASAALTLKEHGWDVTVIEARERIGGRAYARPFGGTGDGEVLEYGGAWITPWHDRIRARVKELGLTLRPRLPISSRLWHRDGVAQTTPVSERDRARHERVLARVAADAALLKIGQITDEKGRPLTGISFADYLDRLMAPKATRDLFSAWWTVSGNGDHAKVAASEFIASCGYGDGLAEAIMDFWTDTVTPGMAALAEAMIARSDAKVLLAAPVSAISQTSRGIEVTTRDGDRYQGDACVVALGINQLPAIAFTPPLPVAKSLAIARGHGGRSFKLWAKVRGVPAGTLMTGDGTGIEFAFAERATQDGAALIVCFGLMGGDAKPHDRHWVKAEIARLFPNSEMLGHDTHDWLNDPFARGTWVAAPAGHEAGLAPKNWQAEGRIAFATSDTARDQAGWFEGAVIAGEDAARWVVYS